ncbi:single-stranded DNA-binding protein [Microbacterium sp. NPDC096154]|uniref:single-stranded DNA-binding protein n=1 Tax=Microbacterium sp. NPDC096154 TaxID=3155549 RepID=UPI003326DCD8
MSDTITITGNIATPPQKHILPSGIAVTRFRLASGTRRYDREAGQWVDGPTNWYSVAAYRALADNAESSLHKGERVVVTGRLRLRVWEADGRKGMEAEVDADALGHDLRFGTSVFQRTVQRPAAAGAAPAAPEDAQDTAQDAQQTAEDAWATPGAPMGEGEPVPDPHPDAEVGETPF